MESRFEQQLKKGVLEMLVLGLVCEQESYGYALLARLEERSGGFLKLKEGTLYPILYRLEDEGLITASWQAGPGGGAPQKYYQATPAGEGELCARRQAWAALCACVEGFEQKGANEA